MSRASDQIKETRSYVISEDRAAGLKVKGSHWAVGYTPGHKATPLEALDYAIEDAEQKMTEAQAKVVELHDLRATMVAEAWEPKADAAWPGVVNNWPLRGDE